MEVIDLQSNTLSLSREFRASPEKLFKAWTDPKQLAQWWGPKGMTCPLVEMEIIEGGAWLTTMQNPEGGQHTVSGKYKEITPHSRLVFTWAWQDEDGRRKHETEVCITFEPSSTGTKLHLFQKIFENDDQAVKHNQGWSSSFECLGDYVANLEE